MQEFVNSSKKNQALSDITNQKAINTLNQEILKQKMAQFFVQPSSPHFDVLHDDIHHINMNDPNLVVHHEMPSKIDLNSFKFKEKVNPDLSGVKQGFNSAVPNFAQFRAPPQNVNPFKPFYLNQNNYDKNVIPQVNLDFIPKELKVK